MQHDSTSFQRNDDTVEGSSLKVGTSRPSLTLRHTNVSVRASSRTHKSHWITVLVVVVREVEAAVVVESRRHSRCLCIVLNLGTAPRSAPIKIRFRNIT